MITKRTCNYIYFIILSLQSLHAKNGLTYDITGRLGDNIMTFCQHKWLAYNHNLDLYVPDFKYKEFFHLAVTEKSSSAMKHYKGRITLNKEADLIPSIDHYLYNSSYYMCLNGVATNDELGDFLFKKSIEDPDFGAELSQALSLQHITCSFDIPKNKISVAVHVRKGCDFDYPLFSKQYESDDHSLLRDKIYSDHYHHLKFPPEQFYAEQLKKLYEYLGKEPLYVHVFSDAAAPQHIVDRMQKYIGATCDITFATQKSDYLYHASIMADIYAMSRFDYLIRSESHFPWMAQMLGNHKGIIRPVAYAWQDTYLHMTRTLIDIPDREQHLVHTLDF